MAYNLSDFHIGDISDLLRMYTYANSYYSGKV